MALWKPPGDQVGDNEHVGRRLFDEPMLIGAKNQKPYSGLDIRHFEETRDDEQFSLDRLGRSSIEPAVVRYLRPRAEMAGGGFKPAKAFNGWAVLRAHQLANPPVGRTKHGTFPVFASPDNGDGLLQNSYHAHIIISGFDHYSIALHLRHLFLSYGTIYPMPPVKRIRKLLRYLPANVREWLLRKFDSHTKRI
jgi:hypothetical protein